MVMMMSQMMMRPWTELFNRADLDPVFPYGTRGQMGSLHQQPAPCWQAAEREKPPLAVLDAPSIRLRGFGVFRVVFPLYSGHLKRFQLPANRKRGSSALQRAHARRPRHLSVCRHRAPGGGGHLLLVNNPLACLCYCHDCNSNHKDREISEELKVATCLESNNAASPPR